MISAHLAASRAPASQPGRAFDYIIVGAGSAGCVLANRLSADPAVSVLLLEAGPDIEPFWVRAPAGLPFLFFNPEINWCFSTEEERELAGRKLYWPRGKLMGGSSAINGMLYMRGDHKDYDDWAAMGNTGWSYQDVLPYFRKSETWLQGANEWRGGAGPLHVSRSQYQHPVTATFLASAVQAGVPVNDDFNGRSQEGVGYCQHTIAAGVRRSSSNAYVNPVRTRPNLVISANSRIHRVSFADGAATGVDYERDGQRLHASARREVLLCAGALGSPHVLLLSGVGPAAALQRHGIAVIADRPGVGENLQDHLGINTVYEVRPGMSMNSVLSGWRKYMHGVRYLLNASGPLAMGTSHAQAFIRSEPGMDRPDVQLSFRPWSFTFEKSGALRMHPFASIQIAGLQLRPQSRGTVSLASADPLQAPLIRPNYLSAPKDRAAIIRTLKSIRRIVQTGPLADLIVQEKMPGRQVQSDEELLQFIRQESQSYYHPVGSCRMGQDDDAVVDERLRVKGVRNLRVVDASIMPALVGGNTNAPTIMIAEKAADLILEDQLRH